MEALRQEAGFHVLENDCHVLGDAINVVGLNEISGSRLSAEAGPDERKAFGRCPQNDLPFLVLAHQPNHINSVSTLLERDLPKSRHALMLSGHTHGGQIFPATLLVGFFNSYSLGYHTHTSQLDILVGRGTGQWGPLARLGSRAEIISIKLTP